MPLFVCGNYCLKYLNTHFVSDFRHSTESIAYDNLNITILSIILHRLDTKVAGL